MPEVGRLVKQKPLQACHWPCQRLWRHLLLLLLLAGGLCCSGLCCRYHDLLLASSSLVASSSCPEAKAVDQAHHIGPDNHDILLLQQDLEVPVHPCLSRPLADTPHHARCRGWLLTAPAAAAAPAGACCSASGCWVGCRGLRPQPKVIHLLPHVATGRRGTSRSRCCCCCCCTIGNCTHGKAACGCRWWACQGWFTAAQHKK
jgi:hypothetical protein